MQLTDLFIKRPVLATVVSLLILVLGIRSMQDMPLQEFPSMDNAVIQVSTSYAGANSDLMQGFVAAPLQKSIATASGIDYLVSESSSGSSNIKAYLKLGYNSDKALTEIMNKVAEAKGELPKGSDSPIITKDSGSNFALAYLTFSSRHQMNAQQIADYIERVVKPKIQTVSGIAKADIMGSGSFAMRIWFKPDKLAAYHLSTDEVISALQNNNYQTAPGSTQGEFVLFNLNANTSLTDIKQFEDIIVKYKNGAYVHLRDLAKIELGAETYDVSVYCNGKSAVFLALYPTPTANPLTVMADFKKILPIIQQGFPEDLEMKIVYDSTLFIQSSVHEVISTIIEAAIIVIFVIFLFLGALRTVIIPMITIPLSLIGVASIMLALGYSLNTLTLLSMVLAIGLVVDDAIVVLENVYRHIEEGLSPFQAAIKGAREIATPVVAMTITLAAVYAPIGMMGGLTGKLFTEFAFTLAGAVIISGIIALTLSPMMCSKILSKDIQNLPLVKKVDKILDELKHRYLHRLQQVLEHRPVVLVFAAIVITSCIFLFKTTAQELAPTEDKNFILSIPTAPEYANVDYLTKYTKEIGDILATMPGMDSYFIVNGAGAQNSGFAGLILKPIEKRNISEEKVLQLLQPKLNQITGLQTFAFEIPPLPSTGQGMQIGFVLTATSSHTVINQIAQKIKEVAEKSGMFMYIDTDLKFNQPQLDITIDREKVATLGLGVNDVGNALTNFLSGGYISRFSIEGKSYKVIPRIANHSRLNPEDLYQYYVKNTHNKMVPLASVLTFNTETVPSKLTQFQQLNAITLQGQVAAGHTITEGLNFLQEQAAKYMPSGMSYDYSGLSRQTIQEGNSLTGTFFFALLIIFLVLAAQFESFRDPFIILISVPMSICGALIPLNIGFATLNIYTQIGLVTLIGLISKHGILMVDFANHLQETEHLSIRDSIEKAASIRLRPILMTTAAMIMGVIPLITSHGAGAVSRYNIGLVIASGMAIGTLFTLFVVPTVYTLLAHTHTGKETQIES